MKNLYLRLNMTRPKPPKKTTKGKNKGKGGKKKKIPLEELIKGRAPVDLMGDLSKCGVLKKLAPAKMSDFLGDHNYLRTLLESKAAGQPDPSLAQLREVCTSFIALPMADGFKCGCEEPPEGEKPLPTGVTLPEDFKPKEFKCEQANRTFMFYGPQGTGKSLMARAIASETNAIVLDISAYNVADRFKDNKKGFQQMLVTTFRVAKEFQPSIILIDEIEQYFPGKIKKNKKKGAPPPPVIGRCSKFKKDFLNQVAKHLAHTDRVSIIGMTNRPNLCNLKEVTSFFYKKFYFPYPDAAARQLIFKHLVEKNGVKLTDAFKLSMFSHVTEGVTPGSMSRAIQTVLTNRRKTDIVLRPLVVQDFTVPISENYSCSAEEYAMFNTFTNAVTGITARLDALENGKDDKKNPKKGGKR